MIEMSYIPGLKAAADAAKACKEANERLDRVKSLFKVVDDEIVKEPKYQLTIHGVNGPFVYVSEDTAMSILEAEEEAATEAVEAADEILKRVGIDLLIRIGDSK